jgi:hypothetical protein
LRPVTADERIEIPPSDFSAEFPFVPMNLQVPRRTATLNSPEENAVKKQDQLWR